MTPAQRALLRDCATALEDVLHIYPAGSAIFKYYEALQQRIRAELAKKGKRK